MDRPTGSEKFVIAFAVVGAVGAFFVAKYYSLWVLVPLPSVIALVYHLLNLSLRFDSRKEDVAAYRNFASEFLAAWRGEDPAAVVTNQLSEDLNRHRPTLASMIWGSALLTVVFALPAVISAGGSKLDKFDTSKVTDASTALTSAQSAKTIDAAKKSITAAQKAIKDAGAGLPESQRGIVYAGFGVWVLIVLRTIGRINAGGLSARFLINASLRAGAAMMLGFFVGSTGFFGASQLADVNLATAYFITGLFYPLLVENLRDKALQLFKQDKNITKDMPSNWVDGVDDDTQDILTEVNVLDVQHLATSDPGLLSVRTLFEFSRVFDLINQAMLIEHFREKIVELRALRIHGVTDFVLAVEPAINRTAGASDADALVDAIVTATGKTKAEVLSYARTRMKEFRVNLFIGIVQSRKFVKTAPAQQTEPMISGSARLPIQGEGQMSFDAFPVTTAVQTQLENELRQEARRDAQKYRMDNPDAQPTDAVIGQSYDQAYPVALGRATIGTNPKPGKRTREVYDAAYRSVIS